MENFTAFEEDKQKPFTNWAGNLTYGAERILAPETTTSLQEIVKTLPSLRPLGTRHCFNSIADIKTTLISTKNLNTIIDLDPNKKTVTVGGGMRYGEFCETLYKAGFAIHNLASLPHISVAGACATATHGSGVDNGNLATSVSSIKFVNAKGDLVSLSREKDGDVFNGAVVSLGCLGIVSQLTLNLIPSFSIQQEVYLNLPMAELQNNFEAIMSAGYSVSLFTDWQSDVINQVWIKRKCGEKDAYTAIKDFFGATLATTNVHPIIEMSPENCTEQRGVTGPWHERLPHFKMNFTPSSGEELQAEYFVPAEHAVDAIRAVRSLKDEIKPVLMISEIRTIAADDFWLSPCYRQNSVAIHFTLYQKTAEVMKLLPKIEEKLSAFNVKPHWGKLFSMNHATLQQRYARLSDFISLVAQHDPNGKFRNEFISRNVIGTEAAPKL